MADAMGMVAFRFGILDFRFSAYRFSAFADQDEKDQENDNDGERIDLKGATRFGGVQRFGMGDGHNEAWG